jgi:hypothetical protein
MPRIAKEKAATQLKTKGQPVFIIRNPKSSYFKER